MIDMSTPPEAPAPPRRSWVWAILGAVVLFAAGIGVGWLASDQPSLPATTTEESTPTVLAESEEPAADVADALLPSLVHIDTGFGVGSGVIYDSSGLILTAAHVVDGVDQVTVRLSDGERLEGRVVGTYPPADIAVIKIDRNGLPAAPLALDEEPRVGQMAIALGSPWGLERTVTVGYVSAVNRSLAELDGVRTVIQTDAPINPGNSGGPLADRHGRVIGINVSIFSPSGGNDGVGFAVPIRIAREVADDLVAGVPISRAFLGVSGRDPVEGQAGALIEEVVAGSAAEEAGLQPGDLVVAINGIPVRGMIDLAAQVQSLQPGSEVTLGVIRDGEPLNLTTTLGESDG